jgi:ribosomal protein S12 methylthiotransferase
MVKPIKIGFVSLGCSKNQVDSEVMLGTLVRSGFELTREEHKAEILIANTCGFIDKAKQESIDTIIELGRLKQTGQCKLLIATGCLTERYRGEILKELPELDAIVGTGDFPRIADLCRFLLDRKDGSRAIPVQWAGSPTFLYGPETPRLRIGPRHWAYVKVSEGCHRTCSFCIIPQIRGNLQSRPAVAITEEVERLAEEGVKEVNLVAQDMSSYGIDRGQRDGLVNLLRRLSTINGIRWIRLLYLYPHRFPPGLMELMASEEKICSYVDLPLQHIDDDLLRRMNRGGSSSEIRCLLNRLKNRIPGLILRTTFIVGFPGETERKYKRLYDFIKEIEFDRVGVFTYSPEEGTSAFPLGDPIPEHVKMSRRDRLLRLQARISLKKNSKWVGQVHDVLVEGLCPDTGVLLEGRTSGHAPEIDGKVYINEGEASPGEIVPVEITQASSYDLVGRILRPSQSQLGCSSHPAHPLLHPA